MNRRRFLAAVGTAATASLAGCSSVGGEQTGDVQMRAVSFSPAEYTVAAGDEVVWHNPSSRSHTVTAYANSIPDGAEYFASGGYDSERAAREAWRDDFSGAVTSGETYSHTFEVAGTYEYVCIPHEQGGMVGRVVVEE
jgi:plastocyanin